MEAVLEIFEGNVEDAAQYLSELENVVENKK